MTAPLRRLTLATPDDTARFAAALAPRLTTGDIVLLEGPIGAGKTHFCRALIQARLAADGAPLEDVPSPTFTLVQTYTTPKTEIWHADLYRVTHPDEVEELGLLDAFDDEITLVEWPDRLGSLIPTRALLVSFEATQDDRRVVRLSGPEAWAAKLDPVLAEFSYDT